VARRALTARQVEVIGLLAEGLTDAEVGERLGCSWATVRTHAESARNRLGARNRAHLVGMWFRSHQPPTQEQVEEVYRWLTYVAGLSAEQLACISVADLQASCRALAEGRRAS